MNDHLTTPTAHRLLTSPLGRAVDTGVFERLKTESIPREFGIQRARAAADVAIDARKGYASADRFCRELPSPPSPPLRERIEAALDAYETTREAHESVLAEWDAAFWEEDGTSGTAPSPDSPASDDERVDLERRRRELGDRRFQPTREFGFLRREHVLPPMRFAVPDADTAETAWADELADPGLLYGLDAELPTVEQSRTVRGPGTVESLLRFDSPAPWLATTDESGERVPDTAFARVYEPAPALRDPATGDDYPTVVYGSGWGLAYDQLTYWPEEEYVGRALAREGYRVILPEYPWHGRRTPAGEYSGERYLATAPVGLFQLYAAAAVETGVLVAWARNRGAPAVAVGGTSLGGIVALHVAGWCDRWPAPRRPDLVIPVAATGDVPATVTESDLPGLLGLDDALAAAGWTDERLRRFAPLLSPPDVPGIDPGRVYPFLGHSDRIVPTDGATRLFDRWGVPTPNRRIWDRGHFGMLVRLIREPVLAETVGRLFDSVSTPSGDTPGGESASQVDAR